MPYKEACRPLCAFLALGIKMPILDRTIGRSSCLGCCSSSPCAEVVGWVSAFCFCCVRFGRCRPLIVGYFRRGVLFQRSGAELLFWPKQGVAEGSSDVVPVPRAWIGGGGYHNFLSMMYGSGLTGG